MTSFEAFVLSKDGDGQQQLDWTGVDDADLMPGDVTVEVAHSTVNYKDGLALTGRRRSCAAGRWSPGSTSPARCRDSTHAGSPSATRWCSTAGAWARPTWAATPSAPGSRASGWCRCPAAFTAAQAMAIGTAGYTAMLCVLALERHGVTPDDGPVLVTGAAGGVGSVAVALLWRPPASRCGLHRQAGEAGYLEDLGAAEVIDRAELSAPGRPLQGALGRRRRCGRQPHARQRPGRHPLRRHGRRLRPGPGHGPPRLRGAVHPPRRHPRRRRQRDGPPCRPRRRPGPAWRATSTRPSSTP